MHVAFRHRTPSFMSLPKDEGESCFGRSYVLRQFSRHMFCYANQMSKAWPRKRHAELEELDFKL